MTRIDQKSFIDEFAHDMEVGDLIKARAVLAHIEEADESARRRVLLDLSRSDDNLAIPLLGYLLSRFPDFAERYPTLREMLLAKVLERPDRLLSALKAGQAREKVLFIGILGEIRVESEIDLLMEILADESDEEVLRAAIAALGSLGDPRGAVPVSEFLYSGRRPLIVAAIQALGRIGSPTAIQRLAERLGTDEELDQMIVDMFAAAQDSRSLDELNILLRSHYAHLRSRAKARLAEIGPKVVPMLTQNLLLDDPDLRIHSLNLLGAIGDASAFQPVRKLLQSHPADPNVRFAAFEAIGLLPCGTGAYTLADGLTDPVEHVRVAAARAIDRNFSDVLAAGLKNLVRDGDDEARRIIEVVVNAQADRIFMSLLGEEPFRSVALPYLAGKAHPDIREHFRTLLVSGGYRQLAAEIASGREEEAKGLRIFAVDDSRMILGIYKAKLHALGHEPVLFEFPVQAAARLERERPDMLLTDLNMPEMTGLDLTRAVRRLYPKGSLPIVLVTTQNDRQDDEAALAAGVDEILRKPFTDLQLSAAIDRLSGRTGTGAA